MRILTALLAAGSFVLAIVSSSDHAPAQEKGIALKSGESAELGTVYWIARDCRSKLTNFGGIDILEGPSEVTVTIREQPVKPERRSCTDKVPGGMLVIKAGDIKEQSHSKLTFRVNYKTKDGDRQSSRIYNLSLYP